MTAVALLWLIVLAVSRIVGACRPVLLLKIKPQSWDFPLITARLRLSATRFMVLAINMSGTDPKGVLFFVLGVLMYLLPGCSSTSVTATNFGSGGSDDGGLKTGGRTALGTATGGRTNAASSTAGQPGQGGTSLQGTTGSATTTQSSIGGASTGGAPASSSGGVTSSNGGSLAGGAGGVTANVGGSSAAVGQSTTGGVQTGGASSTIGTTGGASPTTGGAPPVTGGAPPDTGGASPIAGGAPTTGGASAAGGASPITGGASPITGGASPITGGASPITGGAPAVTGGAPPITGGAPPITGGAPATGGSCATSCTPGVTQCASSTSVQTCVTGGDGCQSFVKTSDCSSPQTCQGSGTSYACACPTVAACTSYPNGGHCADTNTLITCAAVNTCQQSTTSACAKVANEKCVGLFPNAKCEVAMGYWSRNGNPPGTIAGLTLYGERIQVTSANLQLTRLGLITTSSGSLVHMAIYADNGGSPGTWLASAIGGSNSIASGYNEFAINNPNPAITPVTIQAGYYWIFVTFNSDTTVEIDATQGSIRYLGTWAWDTAFPTNLTGLTTYSNVANADFYVVGIP